MQIYLKYVLNAVLMGALLAYSSAMTLPGLAEDVYAAPLKARFCVTDPKVVRAVLHNHFKNLNACNVQGLKNERTRDTQLFAGGSHFKTTKQVDDLFSNFCLPRRKGGFAGLNFTEQGAFIVGNVASVLWRVDAPFLYEPYYGSEAYVTCGRKILTFVSSFEAGELKIKQ